MVLSEAAIRKAVFFFAPTNSDKTRTVKNRIYESLETPFYKGFEDRF